MNKKVLNYIKTLSNNKTTQELLIETIGKLLLKQNNVEEFMKENNEKISHIRDWISSVFENKEQWKTPRVLTIEALNNAADKYFQKKDNKIQTIKLNEDQEKIIADLGEYYIVKLLTPEALDNESKQMQHCIGHGGYDNNLKKKEYEYLSLRDKFNKAHVTLESKNNEILQFQGKQNKISDKKYLEILLPWLMEKRYKKIPWKKIGKYYENGQWYEIDDINIKEGVDCIKIDELKDIPVYEIKNEKINIYFAYTDKYTDKYILVNENKEYCEHRLYRLYEKGEAIQVREYFELLQRLHKKGYKNIPYQYFQCIHNENDNEIYSILGIPDNIIIESTKEICFSEVREKIKLPDNMHVKGNLIFEYCDELYNLSKNLFVEGDLYIIDCDKINKLSDNLVVTGDLYIESCKKLKEIPKNIKVGKDIVLLNSGIEKLPEKLVVNGKLEIKECRKLKKISDNILLNGDLVIESEEIELPDILHIKGNFKLEGCDNLKKFPSKLIVEKNLDILKTNIKELPKYCTVGGSIDLYSSAIEKLPDNLIVNGNFNLSWCRELQEIPKGLVVNGDLNLCGTNIGYFPKDIIVKNNLNLSFSKIKNLHDNLNINGDLCLMSTDILIPDNLEVNGKLNLCLSNIESLPDTLKVGSLFLNDSNIKKISEKIDIKKGLSINGCKNIEELPNNLNLDLIIINENQINLINENMNFNKIYVTKILSKDVNQNEDFSSEYSRDEFFDKFKKENNVDLSFSKNNIIY